MGIEPTTDRSACLPLDLKSRMLTMNITTPTYIIIGIIITLCYIFYNIYRLLLRTLFSLTVTITAEMITIITPVNFL